MLETSVQRLLERLSSEDVILDIGGWGKPFTRADWVMDLMPFQTRGCLGRDGPGEERFNAGTWIQRDICDPEPYPFADKQLDFVVCSHTLEDVRDPLRVCREMIRIARAGYIEVPSRLEEQAYGIQGPWVGWGHHRWLIDVRGTSIEFVFKHHVINRPNCHFPLGFSNALPAEQLVQGLWWEESFDYAERVFVSEDDLDPYLVDFVVAHRHDVTLPPPPPPPSRLRRVARSLRSG
jgi:SAM-dependent methyltransferase